MYFNVTNSAVQEFGQANTNLGLFLYHWSKLRWGDII